jgi:hypothetical protein
MQHFSTAVLLACLLAPLPRAQHGAECPNVRATNVPAQVKREGSSTRCGFGVSIFGLSLSIGGARCYRNEFIYPAHQECQGARNAGTACVPASDMPVALEHCECLLVGVMGTGVAAPRCNCTAAGTAGTIEDAETVLCSATS